MIRHDLTEEEIRLAKQIARERNDNKKKHNIHGGKVDNDRTDHSVHIDGAKGEVATAHEFGLEIDRSVQITGDSGWDCKLGRMKFEVKTRGEEEKDFAMYDDETDLEADIGILCWLTDNTVTIAGWITRAEWLFVSETLHFGKNPRRGIPWRKMRSPNILYRLTNQYKVHA